MHSCASDIGRGSACDQSVGGLRYCADSRQLIQARPPLLAMGPSTISANVLVEASAASMIRVIRSVTDLRFIGGSWVHELTMDESSGLNRIQVFGTRPVWP